VGAHAAQDTAVIVAWLVLQFAVCAVLIARAGYVLSRSADALAGAYGWGRGWVGLALLATVTSLPELASGISAVAFVDAPNLAVGNALGACVVNLLFLVVVDALQRQQPMYREASATHLLSAGFGVVMLAVDDVFYVRGSLLADAASLHAGTAVTALVMTGLVIIGLVMRPQGRTLRVVSWVSVGLAATCLVNAVLIYVGGV
jgi:cation:H+ antiporter